MRSRISAADGAEMVPFSLTDEELAQIRLMQTGQNVPFYQAFAKACGGEDEFAQKCRKSAKNLKHGGFRRKSCGYRTSFGI